MEKMIENPDYFEFGDDGLSKVVKEYVGFKNFNTVFHDKDL